jgi:CDP-glucose 4,6-dehydratase
LAERLAADNSLIGQAFNFSNETKATVLQVVGQILALMRSEFDPEVLNEAVNEIREQYLNAQKARQILGWKPLFTLDEGLRHTIDWYREFLGAKT